MIFTISYLGVYGSIILVSAWLVNRQSVKSRASVSKINIDDLTLIVPFRNEQDRVLPLLQSLKNMRKKPRHIIFVDDNSSDNSAEFIKENFGGEFRYLLLESNVEFQGKKANLLRAIEATETKWVLTMDADVEFDVDYFEKLQEVEETDMCILPVRFIGSGFLHHYFGNDILLSQFINVLADHFKRPIMASGANLLFSRDAYLQCSTTEHFKIASGDDQFLLKDFIRADKSLALIQNGPSVRTPSPDTFHELLSQRARWIGKTGAVKDKYANILFVTFAMLVSVYAFLVGFIFMSMHIGFALWFFIAFSLITYVSLFSFYKKSQALGGWLFAPLYIGLFLPYAILLKVVSSFKNEWKGRK